MRQQIVGHLEEVALLNEDRILRRFLELIETLQPRHQLSLAAGQSFLIALPISFLLGLIRQLIHLARGQLMRA